MMQDSVFCVDVKCVLLSMILFTENVGSAPSHFPFKEPSRYDNDLKHTYFCVQEESF